MKTKTSFKARKNKTAKKRGSGPGMSRQRPRQAWLEPTATSPIERVKKDAIDKVMIEVIKYYGDMLDENWINMNSRKPTTWIPSRFRSRPRPDKEMTIHELAKFLKNIDINREKFFNLSKEEDNEFYSRVALAYFNSKNYKEYLENVKPLRREFYAKLRTIYLPKVISVTEVRETGRNTKEEMINAKEGDFLILGNEYLTKNEHIYKISYNVNQGRNDFFTYKTDILVHTYWLRSNGLSLFDKDKFPTVSMDGMENLLHTMSAHPNAAQALDASTVDLIAEYTGR